MMKISPFREKQKETSRKKGIMFRESRFVLVVILLLLFSTPLTAQEQSGRIYGTITLTDGDSYEGRITWGWGQQADEVLWTHTFDAEYDYYENDPSVIQRQRERDRRRANMRIKRSLFSVMFGLIETLERRRDGAMVTLKDGREFDVSGGDCGETLTVNDADLGKIKITWRHLVAVEFMDEPADYGSHAGDIAYPLFGTVTTRSGYAFTGFIVWDNDESLSTHILNGKEGQVEREIPFKNIRSIAPRNRRSSNVTLWTGRKLTLGGTNDVNDENRGVSIVDPDYGIVEIGWRDIEKVEFEQNVNGMRYDDFEAGIPLYGTLQDDSGAEHSGFIRWDDDENVTTDYLNGDFMGILMKIEFGKIHEIRRRTRRSATVVLKNGAELNLKNSNDVDYRNRGIVVLKNADSATGTLFEWDEFEKVTF